jgi:glycosyltransferase involved in cell wall biosynthesis
VYEVSRELVKRGHEVTVHTTNALDPKTDFGVKKSEYYVEGMTIRYYKNVARFGGLNFSLNILEGSSRKEIRNSDVVHMHGFRTFQNVVAHDCSRRFRIPYVLTGHGTLPRIVEKIMQKKLYDEAFGYRLLKDAFRLIASSNIEKQQYIDLGVPSAKVVIIPNGINTQAFDDRHRRGAFKRRFGIPEDSDLVLYVGRVHRRKGIGFLLDAFSGLKGVNAALVIAGSDDGYMAALKEKAARLGILEKVLFTGFVSEQVKLAAYCDSKVVVYPGIFESFPIVPLEAALCSKPVIVSDDSVMGEIVAEGGFGVAVRYGDVAQLRDSVSRILKDARIADAMGRKGREFVKRNYDWRDIVSRLETVYSNAVAAN